ncbi:MAG: ATP-binding protein [Candidatus Eremiobacteraeota bacterium]|nr:ATP-binding protein [Candidatus Eremiobacteraeota bacterium]MCW5867723.1 ATP-binding protein [Candidatus Eremiobacteraeota bacterium]
MWIERDFAACWRQHSLPVRLVTGPRQSGKSTFLRRLCDHKAAWLSLDDLHQRELAQTDPRLFLTRPEPLVVLDEVQLAPQLLPEIKRRIDEWRMSERTTPQPAYWLTGSNQILLDRGLKESLAGRANYFSFSPLSIAELQRAGLEISPPSVFLKGGWPQLHAEPELSPVQYLNDYISTVVEKDIVSTAGIQKVREFLKTVRLLAARTGQILVVSNLTQDSGVKQPTLHDWIGILERMQVLSLVEPYSSSLSKRLVRTPKLYWNDVGLASRLQGWGEADPLILSPQLGPLFETLAFTEIQKTASNYGKSWRISYVRNKEQDEVDFLLEGANGTKLVVEAKWSSAEALSWRLPRRLLSVLEGIPQAVVSYLGGLNPTSDIRHLSLTELGPFLLERLD